MSWFPTGISSGDSPATVDTSGNVEGISSQLWNQLMKESIVPGYAPSYELCKTLYSYHPLGRKMVELPLEKAFSQERELTFSDPLIPVAEILINRFKREWKRLGGLGGNTIIYRIGVLSRVYGVGTLLCGTRGQDLAEPLDFDTIHKQDLFFSMLDPLNTAGSLVLNQDPTAADFLQPVAVTAAGKTLDRSRTAVLIHEQPIWIEWTDASFGFIGRSVYQRALFPLKSYIYSLMADNETLKKLMLLIAKMKAPGSVQDRRTLSFFGVRRATLKQSATGNVLSIGIDEAIESLNLEHVDKAGTYARNNAIRNVAAASGMPAILLLDERMADGFGEGSEDAKEIAIYIDSIRQELAGMFDFLDKIAMARAWNRDWYESEIQPNYSEYAGVDYEAAFYQWKDALEYSWPSLYQPAQPEVEDAENKKVAQTLDVYKTLGDGMDPVNKAALLEWVQDQIHATKHFSKTDIDLDAEQFIHAAQEREEREAQLLSMADDTPMEPGQKPGPRNLHAIT